MDEQNTDPIEQPPAQARFRAAPIEPQALSHPRTDAFDLLRIA
jgi:hypothetical protein